MQTLNNVTTTSTYPSQLGNGASLGPLPNGVKLAGLAANNSVFVQIWRGAPGNVSPMPEIFLPPSQFVFSDVQGVMVRSAVSGSDAQVTATIWESGDPEPDSLNPFDASISPSGGWAPPVANVKAYVNSALVGSEIGLNLVAGDVISLTGVDEPANSWTKITVGLAPATVAGAFIYSGAAPTFTPQWETSGAAPGFGVVISNSARLPKWSTTGSTGAIFYCAGGEPTWSAVPARGSAVVASGATPVPVFLAPGAAGTVLTSGGVGVDASWATVSTLPAGGTRAQILTPTGAGPTVSWIGPGNVGALLLGGDGITDPTFLNSVAVGRILVSTGAGANPKWLGASAAAGAILLGQAAGDPTFLAAGALGTLLVGKGAGVNPAYLAAGTANQLLHANGAADPTWSAVVDADFSGTLTITKVAPGTRGTMLASQGAGPTTTWLAGGNLGAIYLAGDATHDVTTLSSVASGQILISAGAGVNPKYLAAGASGSVLQSAGAGSDPVWTAKTSGNIWLSAAGMWPSTTNGATASALVESATNKQNVYYMDFVQPGTTTSCEGNIVMPADYNGGTVTATFYWLANDTTNNSVIWGFQGRSYADGDTLDQAWGTQQTATDNNASTANQVRISAATAAVTFSGTVAANDLALFRVQRTGGTVTANARLIGVRIDYTRS